MIDVLITRPYGVGNAVQAIPALRLLQGGDLNPPHFTVWLESRPAIDLLKGQFDVVSRLLEPGRPVECKTWISLFPADGAMEPSKYERRFGYSAGDLADTPGSYGWNEVETNVQIVADFLQLGRDEYELPTCEMWPRGGGRWEREEDVVGIHPGCQLADRGVWLRKRWPADKWKLLIKTLLVRKKRVRVFGTVQSDGDALTPLLRSFGGVDGVEWCMDHTVQDAAAHAGRCEAFISNDSGMAHLALAGGCQKVLILYGPTRPEKNTHDGAVPLVVKACPHQPCYSDVFSAAGLACQNNRCMDTISVQRVLDALI